jgi:hypothetical protein
MPILTEPTLPSRPDRAGSSGGFNDPAWLFEPKYDGFRGMVYLTRQGCTIYSKRGNAFAQFPELVERICAELPRREVILDGEVVAIGGEGRVSFWDLVRGWGYLAYAAFDILWLNGETSGVYPSPTGRGRLSGSSRWIPEPCCGCRDLKSMGASCSRLCAGWTSRGLWRSGRGIRTPQRPPGIRSRIPPTRRRTPPNPTENPVKNTVDNTVKPVKTPVKLGCKLSDEPRKPR